jgi:hypothetical protein
MSDGHTVILVARAMVLPRIILVHIPAGTQRSNSKYENHPSETKDAEVKRAGNRTSAALGMLH